MDAVLSPLSEVSEAWVERLPRTLGRSLDRDERCRALPAEITVGRGRSSRTTPPHEGACATRVRRRTGDLPGPAMHWIKSPGHRAVGSGGHQTNVDGDSRSGNDGHRRGTPLGEEQDYGVVSSCGAPTGDARGVQTPPAGVSGCGRRSFDISVGGTDVRRITGHMAAAQPFVDGGEPTNSGETASSIELWCWAEVSVRQPQLQETWLPADPPATRFDWP